MGCFSGPAQRSSAREWGPCDGRDPQGEGREVKACTRDKKGGPEERSRAREEGTPTQRGQESENEAQPSHF